MYNCPNCNQPILEEDTHCPGCGSALDQMRARTMVEHHKRARKLRLIARSVFSVTVLALTGVAIYYLLSSYNTIRTTAERAPAENPYRPPILVEEVMDGEKGRLLSVFGYSGDRVYVKALNRTLTLTEGSAELFIPDAPFIPQTPLAAQSFVEVDLQLMLYPLSGEEETPIALEPYRIPIPESELALLSPDPDEEQAITTSRSEVEVIFQAPKESTVFLNGEALSIRPADVDTGLYRLNVALDKEGEHTVRIGVQQSGHRLTEKSISVTRLGMPVKLEINPELAKQTTGLSFEITGTTDPNAAITCNLPLSAAIIDAQTGAFRLVATLPKYGRTQIELTAKKGGETSLWEHEVYAMPDKEVYTTTAWALDYEELLSAPTRFKGKAFAFQGTVRSITGLTTQTMDFLIDGDMDKPVTLVYEGLAVLKEGRTYRVFADASGSSQTPPRLDVRFIYEK